MDYDEFSAMNTTIQVAAEGDRDYLEPGFQQVRQFIAECEARFSRFRPESELCQLNRSAGTWFSASDNMLDLIQDAIRMYKLTDGLFDPSILSALEHAGYDRSMDAIRAAGSQLPAHAARPFASHLNQVQLDFSRSAIYLPSGVQIDLGGIAKGWIAEKALSILEPYTPACVVSAGGDMAFHGLPEGEAAWQVALEDPRDENNVLAVLEVNSAALATSTVTRRRWLQGGQERHHIIDPRSGNPAEVEWLSITVVAAHATTAEAFAKAILIGGSRSKNQLVEKIPGLQYIAVNPLGILEGTLTSKEIIYGSV